jgi:hypothetical protein
VENVKKDKLFTSLTLLLILSIVLMCAPSVSAEIPYFSLNPMEYEAPAPGHSFTVDVNVTDVTNMGAFEFKLAYNTTLLDAVNVTPGPQLGPTVVEKWLPEVGGEWTPIRDADGYVWVGCIIKWGKEINGSAILVTINFTATEAGDCTLHFYDTGITDQYGLMLDHEAFDGSVTVVPEFPALLVMPLLMILTLAAASLGKIWSKKRKEVHP